MKRSRNAFGLKTTLLATGRQHGGWREEIKTDGVAFNGNRGGFLETLIVHIVVVGFHQTGKAKRQRTVAKELQGNQFKAAASFSFLSWTCSALGCIRWALPWQGNSAYICYSIRICKMNLHKEPFACCRLSNMTWVHPPEGKKLLNLKIYFNMEFMESNGWGSVAIDWI